jgi:hypothetical protein
LFWYSAPAAVGDERLVLADVALVLLGGDGFEGFGGFPGFAFPGPLVAFPFGLVCPVSCVARGAYLTALALMPPVPGAGSALL